MRTDWIATKVTATPNLTVAEMQRVEWFKRNPAFDEVLGEDPDIEEFIDAEPGEHGAERIDAEGSLAIEITDGPDLKPGDPVSMVLGVVERVPS